MTPLKSMLSRIAEDETCVQTPVIENIDKNTFAIKLCPTKSIQRGVFDWGMIFRWEAAFEDQKTWSR